MDKPEIMRTELLPETTLCDGKYVIEKIIGSGGFGITYLARHAVLGKKYAIKEFFLQAFNVRNGATNSVGLQGMESDKYDHFRKSFIDEAKTLASLSHDGIVKVIDFFDENGTSYIVMPFVEGITLECMVERDGPMEYEMAVNYIMGICDALSYIHSKNILHRDVTPGNIIVTPEQKTVLVDFGSARKFVDNEMQRHTTLVKHGYAPLEQYAEKSKKGAYTDLYSLGGVFYYILTGVRPIDATERTVTKMKEPIELNPTIPAQINAVIMKAMELKSENRYQSASEFAKDIMDGNFPAKKEDEVVQEVTPSSQNKEDEVVQEVTPSSQNTVESKQGKTKYVLIAFFLILLFALLYKIKHQSMEIPADYSSIVISDGDNISMDSLLLESEKDLLQRLDTCPHDPAALFALAFQTLYGSSDKGIEKMNFWYVLISDNDVDKYLIANRKTEDKYEYRPQSFAFVCAARAYENIENSGYSQKTQDELKDSLLIIIEKLKKEEIESNLVYE